MFPWGKFPFNQELKNMVEQMNPKDMQNYVEEMIRKYMPAQQENSADMIKNLFGENTNFPIGNTGTSPSSVGESIEASVFETFDDVFIRIKLPNEETQERVKVFHTSNQAMIENLPSEGERYTITLPSLVKRKGATALIKDHILEVKIPKNVDFQFTEIDVNEKL